MSVRFGVALRNFTTPTEQPDIEAIIDFACLAEDLNLDSVYVWDHILLGSRRAFPVLDSLMTLAAVATRTERVRLGTGVLVLPLRNPTILAKQTATLDRLSNGRLTLGVAVGWYQKEFDAVGIDHERRAHVFVQNLGILYKLWAGDILNIEEQPYVFRNAVMLPPPVQRPRPEVLIGGYVDAALRRVGQHSDGWLNYFYTADAFARSWTRVKEYAQAGGRDPSELTNISQLPICIDETFEQADRRVKEFLMLNTDLPAWSECSYESAIRGTPEQCAMQLAEHVEAGVQQFVFVPYEYRADQLTRIGTEVIPRLRQMMPL